MTLDPFHLAIPVTELGRAREFYGDVLGCSEGRSSESWVDFNYFGHQLVCHVTSATDTATANPVGGRQAPVPHFGVVLTIPAWNKLATNLQIANVPFIIEPTTRFKGMAGEQSIMFIKDPFDNALEFKAFADRDAQQL